jgi:hypothetical protein
LLSGRPEYAPGEEVLVFAIGREEGEFQTAEMLLGKFGVERDESGRLFAVPALVRSRRQGVTVLPRRVGLEDDNLRPDFEQFPSTRVAPRRFPVLSEPDSLGDPRELTQLLDFLGSGAAGPEPVFRSPAGKLERVLHSELRQGRVPEWANLGDATPPTPPLVRWFNNATAQWYLDGAANMTGGGDAEVTGALATWTNDPNSTINYTKTTDTAQLPIHMSATTAPCGWSTCFGPTDSGVVGCGGPAYTTPSSPCPAGNQWRGDCYGMIMDFRPSFSVFPEVWLRCWTQANVFTSATTQAILTHEAGHTLGLTHPDQFASPHDVCPGDESTAIMNSTTEGSSPSTALGTDDQDAIRWIYGDGGNHCATPTPTPTPSQPRTFYSVPPCRAIDTRPSSQLLGGGAATVRNFVLAGVPVGACSIPATAKAVSLNVTVTGPTAAGDLRLFPGGAPALVSTINYRTGQTRANNAIITLGAGHDIDVQCDQAAGTSVHLIIDVNGYFQ